MSIFKCKMCGGTIEFEQGATVGICDSCGTKQTLPRLDDDKKANLYDRANHFRRNNEFDRAMGIYEQILNEDNTDAEAYWSLVLCRYGIEYVEDPTTHRRVPTVNRAQYTSIFADEDYKSAMKYADSYQRTIYEDEAKAIDDIQKRILDISSKEEPFDVFICYKETDASGARTVDSVLAYDLYQQLTRDGFKVFFSRVTLEDKLGVAFEPYIFAALNSAKVMVVIGTKPEHFNAVWVKNEWSRYLALVKNSGGKKVLIPAYRDMDPYDLPEAFSHLQAQDMSKLGFMQDLTRGIRKIVTANKPQKTVVVQSGSNTTTSAQVKRGNIALEDHDWKTAATFFEEALNMDPECAEAYIGKILVRDEKPNLDAWVQMLKEKFADVTSTEDLEAFPVDDAYITQSAEKWSIPEYLTEQEIRRVYEFNRNYESALSCRKNQKEQQLSELSSDRLWMRVKQYAQGETKNRVEEVLAEITAELDYRIQQAAEQDNNSIACLREAYTQHLTQADEKAEELHIAAQNRQEADYQSAEALMNTDTVPSYQSAIEILAKLDSYKDSKALVDRCYEEISRLNKEKRLEEQRQARLRKEKAEIAAKKRKKFIKITTPIVCVCIIFAIVLNEVIIPSNQYNEAVSLMEAGNLDDAYTIFQDLGSYKDAKDKAESIRLTKYNEAVSLMDEGKLDDAYSIFEALGNYKDVEHRVQVISLKKAKVGDYISFGSYEQDNDTSNGNETIEWQVLASKNNKLLVVSKYGLDCKPYNTEVEDVTWKTCTLREWLNDEFINEAFSDDEKAMIPTVTVSADKNPEYDTKAGKSTEDKVFLLSIKEVEKYFKGASAECEPTSYAVDQGAYTNDDNGNCVWWLRSPGDFQDRAALVYYDGSVLFDGYYVYLDSYCVRPALWIDLNS